MKFKSYYPKGLSIIFIFQFLVFAIFSISKKDPSFMYWGLLLVLPVGLLLYFGYLKVEFNKDGIDYSMPPFVNRKIAWDEIERYEIVKISPLDDFMGWGIRHSSKFGWSYILDTNYAISIVKKNGKKLALSINDKDEAIAYLQSIGK